MDKPKVGDTVVSVCEHCGDRFAYTHGRARPRKFCSPECLRVFHVRKRRENSMHKGEPVTCECSVCGNDFTIIYAGRGRLPCRCGPACNAAAGRASFQKWASTNREALAQRAKERRARLKAERTSQKEATGG